MRMISWKYWHAPYHHAHAMGNIAAYDMYQQACDGLLDPDWALSDSQRMSFRDFRLQLLEQMLRYTPSDGLLTGDENFRVVTQRHTNRRNDINKKRKSDSISYGEEGVTPSNYKRAKTDPCSRLCGDLDELLRHTVRMPLPAKFVMQNAGGSVKNATNSCVYWIKKHSLEVLV